MTDLPGEHWEPSNGTEFLDFLHHVCGRCTKLHGRRHDDDPDEYACPIVKKAMDRSCEIGPAPDEWRNVSGRLLCTDRTAP